MATAQQKDLKGMSHIRWQDVYTFEPDPSIFSSVTADTLPLATEDRVKVTEALKKIEGTSNGQLLFQALLAKQHNPDYANGKYTGKKVVILHDTNDNDLAAFTESDGLKVMRLNISQTDKIVFTTAEGKYVKPSLDEIIFHESAHAADQSNYPTSQLSAKLSELNDKTGVTFKTSFNKFSLDTPDKAFKNSLTNDQVKAVLAISDSEHNAKTSQAQKDATYASNLSILLKNKDFSEQYNLTIAREQAKLKAEDLAVDRTNAYTMEVTEGKGEVRGAYFQGKVEESIKYHPSGRIDNYSLKPDEAEKNTIIQKEWASKFGEPVRTSDSQRKDFNPVAIPGLKNLLLDVPLAPSLLHANIQHIATPTSLSSPQTLNAASTNSSRLL